MRARGIFFSLLLMGASATHAQYVSEVKCFGVPFGANKVNALSRTLDDGAPIARGDDVAGSITSIDRKLPETPIEIDRIRRGYKSGIVSAYEGAMPGSSWFGIDLDRHAAYFISRYEFDGPNSSADVNKLLPLRGVAWARKWVNAKHIEFEVVRVLPQGVGATNFGGFICSANALWSSAVPSKAKAVATDTSKVFGMIVDVSNDGRTGYSKRVELGDPVSDSANTIQLWMR